MGDTGKAILRIELPDYAPPARSQTLSSVPRMYSPPGERPNVRNVDWISPGRYLGEGDDPEPREALAGAGHPALAML